MKKSFVSFPSSQNLEVVLNSNWTPIKRAQKKKAGFTETGVVATIAAPLALAKLSMLYMSSFQSAYILVQKVDFEVATCVLSESNFIVNPKTFGPNKRNSVSTIIDKAEES